MFGGDGEVGITWKNQLTSSKRVERDWENDEKVKKGYLLLLYVQTLVGGAAEKMYYLQEKAFQENEIIFSA